MTDSQTSQTLVDSQKTTLGDENPNILKSQQSTSGLSSSTLASSIVSRVFPTKRKRSRKSTSKKAKSTTSVTNKTLFFKLETMTTALHKIEQLIEKIDLALKK